MEEEKKEEVAAENVETKTIGETGSAETTKKIAKPLNKKFILILIFAVIIALVASDFNRYKKTMESSSSNKVTFSNYLQNKTSGGETLTKEEAEKFINENLMESGAGATVNEVTEENGLWKIKLSVNDQEYTAYLTKDKKTFFPQAYDIAEIQKQKAESAAQAETQHQTDLANLAKSDKPVVELFVMSHCPYGTQAEKGIIPVVKALGDKIDFKLKFCDYAMHDEKELREEMNQYCIMQEQGDKFISYLECFLADGDSAKCVTQTGIDNNKLAACVAATDSKYKIMAGYADQTTWKSGSYPSFPIYQADVDKYQIGGSPSLVVNGTQISTDRDPASLLETVCAGFSNKPEECSQVLSSTAPSAGFGYGEGTNTDASCG